MEEGDRVFLANSIKYAFDKMREGFKGEAERLGLKTEEDVVAMVKEMREEMWKEREKNKG